MPIQHPTLLPLALIAAIDQNRLMAKAGGIPWKLPKDVEHFRAYTKDQCLLVGRRTYLEMQGWFKPGHYPIILSSKQDWKPSEGITATSVEQAMSIAAERKAVELICIGGGETFTLAMPFATALVISHVHVNTPPEGEPVYFPAWSEDEWHRTHAEHFPQDEHHDCSFDIVRWERTALQE